MEQLLSVSCPEAIRELLTHDMRAVAEPRQLRNVKLETKTKTYDLDELALLFKTENMSMAHRIIITKRPEVLKTLIASLPLLDEATFHKLGQPIVDLLLHQEVIPVPSEILT